MSVAKVYARAIKEGRYTKKIPAGRKVAVEAVLRKLKDEEERRGKILEAWQQRRKGGSSAE